MIRREMFGTEPPKVSLRDDPLTQEMDLVSAATKIKELEEEGNIFCPTCGACGEPGCCPPDRCKHLKCFYGESYAKSYRELEEENENMRSRVKELEAALFAARQATLTEGLARCTLQTGVANMMEFFIASEFCNVEDMQGKPKKFFRHLGKLTMERIIEKDVMIKELEKSLAYWKQQWGYMEAGQKLESAHIEKLTEALEMLAGHDDKFVREIARAAIGGKMQKYFAGELRPDQAESWPQKEQRIA